MRRVWPHVPEAVGDSWSRRSAASAGRRTVRLTSRTECGTLGPTRGWRRYRDCTRRRVVAGFLGPRGVVGSRALGASVFRASRLQRPYRLERPLLSAELALSKIRDAHSLH